MTTLRRRIAALIGIGSLAAAWMGGGWLLAEEPPRTQSTRDHETESVPPEPELTETDRGHWSFQPLRQSVPPEVMDPAWCRGTTDRYLLHELEKRGIEPLAEASPNAWLRRVTFLLTGLPPTPDAIERFIKDPRPDAKQRHIDRCLADPAFGERAAQPWLDLARFADTDGFEHDHVRPEAWRYRDWVIDAINADLPYDRFVAEQLAGDEVAPDNESSWLATGYLLCGPDMPDINLQQERRHLLLNGMTANLGEVLLGMQFGCAQCHDHKTDPISQLDFYRLRAFLEPIDVFRTSPTTNEETNAGQEPSRALRVVYTTGEARVESRFWVRGDFRRAGPIVEPRFPRILGDSSFVASNAGEPFASTQGRRAALARWVTASTNPLTPRVIVNRMWQDTFGRGIVRTPSDFGFMGDTPSHPALLDAASLEFIGHGWSTKWMRREWIQSQAFNMASHPVSGRMSEQDPENRWLGRMNRHRLDAEVLRDTLLDVAGQSQRQMHGPGVRPPLPAEVTATLLKGQWPTTEAPDQHARRSVYLFVRRNLRFPLFEAFDKPDPNLSCPQRNASTIAPQALHLMNSEFAWNISLGCADRVIAASAESEGRIDALYRITLARDPDAEERERALAFLNEERASNDSTDRERWGSLALALINCNEFLYLD